MRLFIAILSLALLHLGAARRRGNPLTFKAKQSYRRRRLDVGSSCTEDGPACAAGLQCVCSGRRLFGAPTNIDSCTCDHVPPPPSPPAMPPPPQCRPYNEALEWAGSGHSGALMADNTVRMWGTGGSNNIYGVCKRGHTCGTDVWGDSAAEMGANLPALDFGTGRTVQQLACKAHTCCVILDNNDLICWGHNHLGQLGRGDSLQTPTVGSASPPYTPVELGTGRYAQRVAVGHDHVCVILDTDFAVKCFGGARALGQGSTTQNLGDNAGEMGDSLPFVDLGSGGVPVFLQTFDHSQATCALFDTGIVKCWGTNNNGMLGTGSSADVGTGADQMGANLAAVNLGTGRTCAHLAVGFDQACCILDNQDTKCWGSTGRISLPYGDTASRGATAADMGDNLPAVNFGTGRHATQISMGGNQACALLDNGSVKCWGNSDRLGMGLSSGTWGDEATEIGDNWPAVELGTGKTAVHLIAGTVHTCAILNDKTMKCWGSGANGNLGIGSTANIGDNDGEMGDNLPSVNLGGQLWWAGAWEA